MELWETLSNTLDSTLMSCGGGGGGEEGIMIAIDFPPPNSPSTSLGLLNRKGSLSKPFSSSTTPKQKKEKNTQPSMPPVDNTDQSNIILPVIPPYLPRTPNSTKNDQNRLPSSSAVQQKVGSNNITFKNIPTPPIFSVIKQDDAKKTESPSSSSSSSENKTTTKPSPPPSQFYPSSTNELLKLIDLHASSVPKYMKPPKAPFFGYGSVDSFTTAYKLKIIRKWSVVRGRRKN